MNLIEGNTINNPFTACTARDMRYEEVNQYWCDSFKLYGLNPQELISSSTPIIIEGARGTGKTMILKYLTYWRHVTESKESTFAERLEMCKKDGIGIYFRYKADFCSLISDFNSKSVKNAVFSAYFSVVLLRELFYILKDISSENVKINKQITQAALKCMLNKKNEIQDVTDLINYVQHILDKFDEVINSYYDESELMSGFAPYEGIYSAVISQIAKEIDEFKNVKFLILIDEYENAYEFQPLINRLIKQNDADSPITYRIGMRPSGLYDGGSAVGEEILQVDRDFLLRPLSSALTDKKQYKEFIKSVCKKRLEAYEEFAERGMTDIELILGKQEDLENEARSIVGDSDHYIVIGKKLLGLSDDELNKMRSSLESDNIIAELYNVLLYSRSETNDYKKIGNTCKAFFDKEDDKEGVDKEELNHYKNGYANKYKYSLVYLLASLYAQKNKRKKYYSFNTYVFLSTGSVNDFISLCRNLFNKMDVEDANSLLQEGKIVSSDLQTLAATQTADDQMRKLNMHHRFGNELCAFIENLGELFNNYHTDIGVRYPETNQFAFVNEMEVLGDKKLNSYLAELINSGAVIRKNRRQRTSVGHGKGTIYTINKMFAPKFYFSYRTRGGYNHLFTKDDFEKFMTQHIDDFSRYIPTRKNGGQIKLVLEVDSDNE